MLISIVFVQIAWEGHFTVEPTDPALEQTFSNEHAPADLVIAALSLNLWDPTPHVRQAYHRIRSIAWLGHFVVAPTEPALEQASSNEHAPANLVTAALSLNLWDPTPHVQQVYHRISSIAWPGHFVVAPTEPALDRASSNEHAPADLVTAALSLTLRDLMPHVHQAYHRISSIAWLGHFVEAPTDHALERTFSNEHAPADLVIAASSLSL